MSSEAAAAGRDSILVTGAVVANGALGYLVQVVAGLLLTAGEYRDLGVVWAAVFVVAGAMTGLQQEVTRDVRPGSGGTPLSRVIIVMALLFAVPLAVAALLAPSASEVLLPMAVAAAAIAVHGVVTGTAFGTGNARFAALALVLEGVIRTVLLLAVIVAVGGSALPLGLGIALPFIAAALLIAPALRRRTGRVGLTEQPRTVAINIAHTLLASAASAALVSGYPLFLSLLTSVDAVELGAFVFTFTLTRAPLVVIMLGLQSFLVAEFHSRPPTRARLVLSLSALVGGVALLAVLAAALGPGILARFFDEGFALAPAAIFFIVLSAAPLCVLCVTGPLALARGQHGTFAAGWIAAATAAVGVLAVGGLALPLPFLTIAVGAIMVGPVVGAILHIAGLCRRLSSED